MIGNVTSQFYEVTFYFCITAEINCIVCSRSDANDVFMEGITCGAAAMDAK